MASKTPREAAANLRNIVDSFKRVRRSAPAAPAFVLESSPVRSTEALVSGVAALMEVIQREVPLVHQVSGAFMFCVFSSDTLLQITNNVVINDSANATLAIGASPIMATNPRDVADLSPAIGALLVNFGTITDKEGMLVAGRQANVNRKPLVYDPVAVGATSFRRETSKGGSDGCLRDG